MSSNTTIWNQARSYDSPEVISGVGKNRIPPPKEKPLWKAYLEKFEDPLIIILCVILVLSCGVTAYEIAQSGDLKLLFEPAGILMAIILSTGIGFWFEVKAGNEFKILNTVKDDRQVKVIRRIEKGSRPEMMSIKKCDVVPGDIVKLDNGDEVPADGYILSSEDLVVDESAYTGEPLAIKGLKGQGPDDSAYAFDFLLRGSIVVEGSCYYKVSAVGVDTEEGKGAIKLQQEDDVETPLNSQLGQLGDWLTKGSYAIAALIIIGRLIYYFAVYHGGGYDTLHMVEFILTSIMIAVTLIVVAVPEGLPMSVNVSLALSMKKMLKEKNLVRKMHACETMGATTVICTDKTGTLTQNKMTVLENDFKCSEELIATAIAVNSTAELSKKEDGSTTGIGNPTEAALLQWIHNKGINYSDIRDSFIITQREPFSTETKFMSTTVESGGKKYRFYKGAPEIILEKCQAMPEGMTKEYVLNILTSYQSRAMRTLGFAVQDLSESDSAPISYMGVVGIADPVREGVKEAVETCTQRAGVRVIMVTGDVALTASEIGRQIGLIGDDSSNGTITGNEFMSLSDEEAIKILPNLKILSRAHPEDKA
ncbi:MAG: HAD-IC family P-type ATPase, partial [Bacteroidales bacterium]|nr:HAD-IC family P-type ATPase [Bacteroidales bacterium]